MKEDKPYGRFRIARKYLKYYTSSGNKHDVHSPFVYEFVTEVLKKTRKAKSNDIEVERSRLIRSKQVIDFTDFGKNGNVFERSISDMAKKALKSKKYARLLGRIVQFYECKNVLELGTSLGITTAYLAKHSEGQVTSLEGDASVAGIAQNIWGQLGLSNVHSIVGNFDNTLDQVSENQFDMIYIDGNHKLEPTLRYFNLLLEKATEDTLFVLDDIHYSRGMEQAWSSIKNHPRVTASIDLFFLGIVTINPGYSKQEFLLKY